MKIAIIHDWLTGMRGGEKCLEVLCKLYPSADLFTLLHIPGKVSPVIESHRIHTSFIQNLPFVESKYRYYLPLMPFAIETFDLKEYDLILSSSHCVAKSVKPVRIACIFVTAILPCVIYGINLINILEEKNPTGL